MHEPEQLCVEVAVLEHPEPEKACFRALRIGRRCDPIEQIDDAGAFSADPPDRTLAHVYLPGVVVAVDMPYCYMCARGPKGPYQTVAGMTAVARGLKLRPR